MAEYNCINCKYGNTTDDHEHCGNCDKGSEFVKMTNADRIRNMTDEELAEWLTKITDDAQLDAITKCDYQWAEWLKEVKE